MSRGHSWLLGMKTQCMRTKSSTAGSTREPEGRESHRKQGNQKVQKTVKVPFNSFSIHPSSLHNYSAFELVSGLSLATINLSLTAHLFCNIYASFFCSPGSLWCMSILIASRKCSRIFSGVPDITVYLQWMREDVTHFINIQKHTQGYICFTVHFQVRVQDSSHILDGSQWRGARTLF